MDISTLKMFVSSETTLVNYIFLEDSSLSDFHICVHGVKQMVFMINSISELISLYYFLFCVYLPSKCFLY